MDREERIENLLVEIAAKLNKENPLVKPIFIAVMASIISSGILSFSITTKGMQKTSWNTQRDINEIKKDDNFNTRLIAKTLRLDLVLHDLNEKGTQ